MGTLPLSLGVAGHEGSTIIVGLNGLRLLGQRRLASRRQSARRILDDRIDRCPVGVLA
ncbi:hypothetical protein ABGB07_44450 [Micromonosporaceae bacterium B7E4]